MLNRQLAEVIQKMILPIQIPKNPIRESQSQDLQEQDFSSDNVPPTKKEKKKAKGER